MVQYQTIEELLDRIDQPNRDGCKQLYHENKALFQLVQGSTNNHQAWPGGYHDHVQEIMNIAALLYEPLNITRSLPFSLSDALLVVYLHDIEKPWKYEVGDDGQLQHLPSMQTKESHHEFRLKKLAEYGIALNPDQQNGLKYVEGEFSDYSNRRRIMGPLAAFAHLCDVTSARIWFSHPSEKKDPWIGARRNRD